MQGGRTDAMGDLKKDFQGLRVGDFQVGRCRWAGRATRSTPRRTASGRGGPRRTGERPSSAAAGEGAGEDAAEPAEEAMAAVDASIQEARARLKSGAEEAEVPILLRDPVTGATINHR
ncbi:hypothetical protein BE08_04725 [Sorangium cellulosum]|uniref:Uncharacterized protein n=1 Tax=Sorangium cellulosum TaxID=56 RepID=A0A150PAM5_SORCE|nr:hypothetical protein BE08_04725 [Sorangium cellulosum]